MHFTFLIPARDGGDDADRFAVRHVCVRTLEIANVLVADIDVDEVAKPALLVVDLLAELRMLFGQVRQDLPNWTARQDRWGRAGDRRHRP